MALEKFGKKRSCLECNSKFYDLKKTSNLVCPKCGKSIDEDELTLSSALHFANKEKSKFNSDKNEFKDAGIEGDEVETNISSDDDDDEIISLEEIEEDNS